MKLIDFMFVKHISSPFRRSFRKKLMLLMLVVSLLPLLTAAVFNYINAKHAMEQEVLKQNTAKLAWVKNELEDNIERIDEALTAFFFDDNVKFNLNKISGTSNLKSLGINYFRGKIQSFYLANYRDFEEVSFYVNEGLKAFHLNIEDGLFTESLNADYLTSKAVLVQNESLFIRVPNEKGGEEVFDGPYLRKYYTRFENRSLLGVLVVKLKWHFFDKAIDLLNTETGNNIYFVDKTGKVIDGFYEGEIDSGIIQQLINLEEEDRDHYLLIDDKYVFYEVIDSQIFAIKTVPKSFIMKSYEKNLQIQGIIITITGLLVMIITILLGIQVTRPLLRLSKSMQDVEEYINQTDKSYIPFVKSHDEWRILEQSYMLMLHKIDQLINQEYKQKIEIQSAQLMALQAQTNPHFMYNTLQMIGAKALEKDSPEIYEIIAAFSSMMRYNMRMGQELVTVKDELINLGHYLQIQERRFEDKIKIIYHIDQNLIASSIPKMTIQPIVENCFKHGFTKKQAVWQIQINLYATDDDLVIQVIDNGVGIEPQRMEIIKNALRNTASVLVDENLGLKNIDSRMKLHFGNHYGLEIQNGEYGGTIVELRWPKRQQGEVGKEC